MIISCLSHPGEKKKNNSVHTVSIWNVLGCLDDLRSCLFFPDLLLPPIFDHAFWHACSPYFSNLQAPAIIKTSLVSLSSEIAHLSLLLRYSPLCWVILLHLLSSHPHLAMGFHRLLHAGLIIPFPLLELGAFIKTFITSYSNYYWQGQLSCSVLLLGPPLFQKWCLGSCHDGGQFHGIKI